MQKSDHGQKTVSPDKWADPFGALASFLKSSKTGNPASGPSAIREWVGMEEKIVRDHKERSRGFFKDPSAALAEAEPQSPASFETFSTQTTLSSALRQSWRARGRFWFFCGWILATVSAGLYLQGTFSQKDLTRLLTQLRVEHDRLGQSYAQLQSAFEEQSEEVRRLQLELQDTGAELNRVSEKSRESRLDLEQQYRQELIRLTADYETQLEMLRKVVRSREALAEALRIRVAFPDLGVGKESVVSVVTPLTGGSLASRQGKVTLIQGRQGFFVVDLGSDQGARPGREIILSREGVAFASGRIDRAYPTSSAVIPHNMRAIDMIQEGDTVLFS